MPIARTACVLLSLISLSASAQDKLPLFDSHVHYSFNAAEAYPPEVALKWLDQAAIRRAVLSSTPNDGTIKLHALYPERFIPFLRPYRKTRDSGSWAAERQSWYRDAETLVFIEKELARGIYRGIGEFHVNGDEVDTPVMRGIVDIAVKRNLWLMAHSDAAAIEQLCVQSERQDNLGAHRNGRTRGCGAALVRQVSVAGGRALLSFGHRARKRVVCRVARAVRALPGPIRVRVRYLGGIALAGSARLADAARSWLADLPKDVAQKIAYRNGERLFAP